MSHILETCEDIKDNENGFQSTDVSKIELKKFISSAELYTVLYKKLAPVAANASSKCLDFLAFLISSSAKPFNNALSNPPIKIKPNISLISNFILDTYNLDKSSSPLTFSFQAYLMLP